MIRSRKRNLYNKDPTSENWITYRIQRNKCTRMIRDARRSFYSSLDLTNIKDNKRFWKTIRPIFNEKSHSEKLKVLVENENIIDSKEVIASIMNNHFVNITESLDIHQIPFNNQEVRTDDDIENVIEKFKHHPSIAKIKNLCKTEKQMAF